MQFRVLDLGVWSKSDNYIQQRSTKKSQVIIGVVVVCTRRGRYGAPSLLCMPLTTIVKNYVRGFEHELNVRKISKWVLMGHLSFNR